MPSIIGELGAHQPLSLPPRPVWQGRDGSPEYAHHEFAAVGAVRHWFKAVQGLHASTLSATSYPNPVKGVLLGRRQPAQRKLGAQPNELAVLSGPGNSVSVMFRFFILNS